MKVIEEDKHEFLEQYLTSQTIQITNLENREDWETKELEDL